MFALVYQIDGLAICLQSILSDLFASSCTNMHMTIEFGICLHNVIRLSNLNWFELLLYKLSKLSWKKVVSMVEKNISIMHK